MNVAEFIAKWSRVDLKERSAAQEHFLDLCELVGHPKPAASDPTGADFCFEKGAAKHGGGGGFADVWKRLFFGWEYKGKDKDLEAAFDQLLLYKDALDNPPLLIVCDMDRILVRTNFTGTAPATLEIPLDKLGEPRSLEILHHVFFDPDKLKPGKTSSAITQDAADRFAGIADSMRTRGLDSSHVAHFLDRIVFCLFAEDIGLLPDMIFTRIVEKSGGDPGRFARLIGQLFDAMAHGGDFGMETIRHFNGNLFDDRSVLDLTSEEVVRIAESARMDWSAVDPTIFGTLFQRGLDPSKRAQLGAHFTGRVDIEDVVENVIMRPLRDEWIETNATIESLLTTGKKTKPVGPGVPASPASGKTPAVFKPAQLKKATGESASILHQFLVRLQNVKVLDPACGSGNFLYVTLLKLKDLEKEVILCAMDKGLGGFLPMVGPWQLYGIEINPYAFDLAQMTVWIGWLQWIRFNGFGQPQEPILRPMTGNFRCMDAILDMTDPASPKEPEWPKVDFIVGNPPFLHSSKLIRELGESYRADLFKLYEGRVPGFADLSCYWFEKAREHIASGKSKRAGLLATQGIRGGASREVLKRIKETGGIFWAQSDREWILDGANVHVSMVGFDDGSDETPVLDGKSVPDIHANLTAAADTTKAAPLLRNADQCFYGSQQKAPFDIDEPYCIELLSMPNPHGRPNSDVLFPSINAAQLMHGGPKTWAVDYGMEKDASLAACYEGPFSYVHRVIKPLRENHREKGQATYWWLHARPSPRYRDARRQYARVLLSPCVSKHRVFVFIGSEFLADHATVVFARTDDYFFGVLHSHLHEVWALKLGTRLETRPRYTPTTCFETFPLPTPTQEQEIAIAAAARDLGTLRMNWLNPPEWTRTETLEFPGTVGGPWDRYIDATTISDRGAFKLGTVKYPRLVPRDPASVANLAKRTLTNLYNQRPTWLADAHRRLDEAVFAAYGWPTDLTDDQILEHLLDLNLKQAAPSEQVTVDTIGQR